MALNLGHLFCLILLIAGITNVIYHTQLWRDFEFSRLTLSMAIEAKSTNNRLV